MWKRLCRFNFPAPVRTRNAIYTGKVRFIKVGGRIERGKEKRNRAQSSKSPGSECKPRNGSLNDSGGGTINSVIVPMSSSSFVYVDGFNIHPRRYRRNLSIKRQDLNWDWDRNAADASTWISDARRFRSVLYQSHLYKRMQYLGDMWNWNRFLSWLKFFLFSFSLYKSVFSTRWNEYME